MNDVPCGQHQLWGDQYPTTVKAKGCPDGTTIGNLVGRNAVQYHRMQLLVAYEEVGNRSRNPAHDVILHEAASAQIIHEQNRRTDKWWLRFVGTDWVQDFVKILEMDHVYAGGAGGRQVAVYRRWIGQV